MIRKFPLVLITLLVGMTLVGSADAQDDKRKKRKVRQAFKWVNSLNLKAPGLTHATFESPSMKVDVGYCIYLPPGYAKSGDRRYPVVYYLHGGRPGSEVKSVRLAPLIHEHMKAGKVDEMIYVFVNGGPVSHYNMPDRENAMGEDVFVKELIPHIDATYRTVGDRSGRGIEGFSQGGRGTTRIMFRHPKLFSSAAPGGSGYATEKRISEENGRESDHLVFTLGYNTWDLARRYASNPNPKFKIMVHVGTAGFNYQNNLEYMKFLDSLGIAYQKVIVKDAPHSAMTIYQKQGIELMRFHAQNFRATGAIKD